MIVVHVSLSCLPDKRDEMIAALRRMRDSTLAGDDGCLHYAFAVDLDDDCLFTCTERWRDMDALRAHLRATHMAEPDAVIERCATGPADILVFDAEETTRWRQPD